MFAHSEKKIVEYIAENGRSPFSDWLNKLRDAQARAIIRTRLNRVRLGNFGHCRMIGEGVLELKIDFGPGYRIYCGRDGERIVVLLCGGNKRTQQEDIVKAKSYWADYNR